MVKTNNSSKKKKIVIFLPEFPVNTQTFIQRDISKLVELGNLDIEVVALKKGGASLASNLDGRVHYNRLGLFLAFGTLFSVLGNLKIFLNFVGLLNSETSGSFIKNAYLVFKSFAYAKILAQYNPDEIHVHFYSDFSTLAMFSAAVLDVPFSISAHARDVTEFAHLPSKKAEMCRFISVCNENAHTKLLEFSEDNSKVHMIHHGLDANDLFSGMKRTTGEVPVIFMGGTRLIEKKGIEYMIHASKKLKDKGVVHRVVLIGPDEMNGKLQKLVKELGIEDVFEIDARTAQFEEIAKHYFSSDIFVLPNIETESGDVDGIPNVLIEAALSGLAIVSTDAGSNSELIENEKTGLVVVQKDVGALASAVERLVNDVELRFSLGNAAKTVAEGMFGVDVTVRKLEKLLR